MEHSEKNSFGKGARRKPTFELLDPDNGRAVPCSQEAEEHVIACCLLDGSDTIAKCVQARLTDDSFYNYANRLLYSLIVELYRTKPPVTLEMLAEELKSRRKLDSIGGFAYLMQVTGKVPTTSHAGYFIAKVKEKWILRELIRESADAVEQAYAFTGAEGEGGLEDLIAPLALRFNRAVQYARSGFETLENKVVLARARVMAKIEGRQDVTRQLVTGLPEFNQRFGAFDVFEEDFLIGVGGATSVGKSAFTRAIVDDFLFIPQPSGFKKSGMVFLLETTIAKYLELLATRKARWNSRELGRMPKDVQAKYLAAYSEREEVVGKRLHLFEDMVTVEALVARVEDHLREHGERSLDFVVADHLHELYSARQELRRNREAELGYIVKFLKQSAKRLNVPFFLPTQLNRSPAKDGTVRRPTKNDLRGSGELENAYDRLLLLHIPSVDVRGTEQTDNQSKVMLEIIQAKSRNGPIGHREFWFDRPYGDYVGIRDHELSHNATPSSGGGSGGMSKREFKGNR